MACWPKTVETDDTRSYGHHLPSLDPRARFPFRRPGRCLTPRNVLFFLDLVGATRAAPNHRQYYAKVRQRPKRPIRSTVHFSILPAPTTVNLPLILGLDAGLLFAQT